MPQAHKKKLQILTNLIQDIPIQKIPIGLAVPPDKFQTIRQMSFAEQQQISSAHNSILDEIPPLEEDWENGQFTDADTDIINRHNTHSESERI